MEASVIFQWFHVFIFYHHEEDFEVSHSYVQPLTTAKISLQRLKMKRTLFFLCICMSIIPIAVSLMAETPQMGWNR